MGTVTTKRIYDDASGRDGHRVLVDRLWPRGVPKATAELDDWLKDVAPSPGLRTWWNHDPDTFEEFTERYRAELEANDAVDDLRHTVEEHPRTTLLFAAKDPELNHAVVLADYIRGAVHSE